MSRGTWLLGLVVATTVACGADPSRDQLEATPDVVVVDGDALVCAPFLWRDFMPPSTGSDLMAVVDVRTQDGTALPAGLALVRLYVVNGADVWATDFSPETRPPSPPNQIEKIARGGPLWGPGIQVDVVVELVDATGATTYLATHGAAIGATY